MSTPLLPHKTILCVGDFMLDLFVDGVVERISPEAPIPVLKEKKRFFTLGGAGNVVRNLSSLGTHHGTQTIAMGILDEEEAGIKTIALMSELDNVTTAFIKDHHWTTPLKTRFSSNGQQLLRFDHEKACTLTKEIENKLLKAIDHYLPSADIIILSDYHKGTLSDTICSYIIKRAKAKNIPIIVDPKGKEYKKYKGATILTPNLSELKATTAKILTSHENIIEAANDLRHQCDVDSIIVTMGADGMMVVEGDDTLHISAKAKDVFDVSGAGDTVIATLAHALAEGASLTEAVNLANKAGGIVVGKVGTAIIHAHELLESESEFQKIIALPQVIEQVKRWHRQNLKVGFTNGCFDLLHLGHLHLLRQCKTQCDRLILGLNTDASIKRLKGPSRPLQDENVRANVLAALELVDAVILFEEDTPINLITSILPDVLIKGADYTIDQVIGGKEVIQNGGKVYLAELKDGFSTTNTVKKMAAGDYST